jgi:hypothetical protein
MNRDRSRRRFLKLGSAAASLATAKVGLAAGVRQRIAIETDDESPMVRSAAVQWAIAKLKEAVPPAERAEGRADYTIVIAPVTSELAQGFGELPEMVLPETMAFVTLRNGAAVLATGSDVRGMVYAVLELADRFRNSNSVMRTLWLDGSVAESSANRVRSVARAFVSEVEDKRWYYDRAFWVKYLDGLAEARFNRFNFALGFGWDFPRGVTGDYFHFPYPYLVSVPGYEQVHVEPALEAGERQRNLETLKFIAAETARRGMDFQLGIWTHAYQWTDSPRSDHHIAGLTPETHAAYCRDALAVVLKECPQITGLTLRIHGESGIPEGSYPFWATLLEAVTGAGRKIEIDMHAKGLDETMIGIARKTGMPVKAGAKFWAEHLGLGYHQADIRATEYPRMGVTGTFALSSGSRQFTRYGYGDFYQHRSGVELLYRVWPGTQRHLLWGDPALAAGYGRAASFCGAAGMELCEPLTFKGREGSGHVGGRNAYADASLGGPDLDTEKFAATYLLWGRYLYNPETAPEFYHRWLKQRFGAAGPGLETALASASRILPLVTTAWCPSASNHEFWPEMLTPVSILPVVGKPLYGDSPAPHNVSAISPLDPQMFTTIDQHAKDLVSGAKNARYNTSEVIAWLEEMVATATRGLAAARKIAGAKGRTAEFRRAEEDIVILAGLGAYYANLFRAALLYSIHEQTRDSQAGQGSIAAYGKAVDAWVRMAARAKTVYAADVSYGLSAFRRGHWADRVPAMEQDTAALEAHFAAGRTRSAAGGSAVNTVMLRVGADSSRPVVTASHIAATSFAAGRELALSVTVPASVHEAVLWYRHVNHAERWVSVPMQRSGANFAAAVPAAYTASPYPVQYYFELRTATGATLYPAFNPTLSNQPYFAVWVRA